MGNPAKSLPPRSCTWLHHTHTIREQEWKTPDAGDLEEDQHRRHRGSPRREIWGHPAR